MRRQGDRVRRQSHRPGALLRDRRHRRQRPDDGRRHPQGPPGLLRRNATHCAWQGREVILPPFSFSYSNGGYSRRVVCMLYKICDPTEIVITRIEAYSFSTPCGDLLQVFAKFAHKVFASPKQSVPRFAWGQRTKPPCGGSMLCADPTENRTPINGLKSRRPNR